MLNQHKRYNSLFKHFFQFSLIVCIIYNINHSWILIYMKKESRFILYYARDRIGKNMTKLDTLFELGCTHKLLDQFHWPSTYFYIFLFMHGD